MGKREEDAPKRTYRIPKSLLRKMEEEAATNRRPVNTQLEIILEEWFKSKQKLASIPSR